MPMNEPDDYATERYGRAEEPSLGDLADTLVRRIVTAIVIAGALIALAIYFQPSPPRYQVAVGDGRVVRIDSRSGTIITCDVERCVRVLRRGQELEDNPNRGALPTTAPPAAPAAQALPAAKAAPTRQPAPAPAPNGAPATR